MRDMKYVLSVRPLSRWPPVDMTARQSGATNHVVLWSMTKPATFKTTTNRKQQQSSQLSQRIYRVSDMAPAHHYYVSFFSHSSQGDVSGAICQS